MITVIRLKDLIKYIVCIILIILLLSLGIKLVSKKEELGNRDNFLSQIQNSSFLGLLKKEMPLISNYEEVEVISETPKPQEKKLQKILNTELAIMYNLEEYSEIDDTKLENGEDNIEIANNKQEEENQNEGTNYEVPDKADTEVIEEHNIKASFTDENNGIQVNNQTKYNILETISNANYEVKNKDKVIIYHTHTCESYTSSEAFPYEMTGNYRTTDLNYTVSRVGDELEKYLKEYGKTVIHDKTYHDYPAYNGSYGRSLSTVQNILKDNQDAEIMIDLHRDAVGSSNTYGPTVKIGEETCAQVMFVIGTDGSGLYHPNWRKNLEFAVKVQKIANDMYPGLFRPIILRNSRYNQQLTNATTIIEVGATGNTLEQCTSSMKYLAKVLDEAMK